MVVTSQPADVAFLLARVLFGAVLGYLALGNLRDLEGTVAYADAKGVPLAHVSVPLGSLVLLAGAGSLVAGAYPVVGAVAVAAFLVVVTPVMHDFWTLEGQEAQNERVHFLKNVGLLATALVLLASATTPWPFAVGATL